MIKIKYLILAFTLFLISCSKDDETKLEGRWQGTTIESPRHRIQSDSLFWSFDRGVCEIQTLRVSNPHYAEQIYANYMIENDLVSIQIPYTYLPTAKKNRYLDWNTQERKFKIRELTSKSLKFSVNDTIYSFRKYY